MRFQQLLLSCHCFFCIMIVSIDFYVLMTLLADLFLRYICDIIVQEYWMPLMKLLLFKWNQSVMFRVFIRTQVVVIGKVKWVDAKISFFFDVVKQDQGFLGLLWRGEHLHIFAGQWRRVMSCATTISSLFFVFYTSVVSFFFFCSSKIT